MERKSATAQERIKEALDLSRSIGDEFGEAAALARLGDITNLDGDHASARGLVMESLSLFRKLGYKQGISSKLSTLAITEFCLGNFDSARAYLIEGLNTCVEIGDQIDLRINFDIAAALMIEAGNYQTAAQLSGAAAARSEDLAYFHEPVEQRFRDTYLVKLKGAMNESEFNAAYTEGRKMSVAEVTELALAAAEGIHSNRGLRLVGHRSVG
jgi:hypothetical protein